MDRESAVTLTGTVEDVVFYNEDNGYIVVDLDCGGELVTVVGNLGDVREGESLTLLGEYINSPKYGRQFKAEVCERSLPEHRERRAEVFRLRRYRRDRSGDGKAHSNRVRKQDA